jgi:predicted alpha/beta hydrolase
MQLRFFPIAAAFLVSNAFAQRTVSIAVPGQSKSIQADLYGSGNRALILAHGGRFDRASWRKQAPLFAQAGFLVLAVSFRGDTFNQDGSPSALGSNADNATDVLAAVAYLQQTGAKTISAIGASLGGDAIGEADSRSQPGVFDRLVFLGSDGGATPEKSSGRKLFIVARDDKR